MEKNKAHFLDYTAPMAAVLSGALFLAGILYTATRAASSVPAATRVEATIESMTRIDENKARLSITGKDGKSYSISTNELGHIWSKYCTPGKGIVIDNANVDENGQITGGLIDKIRMCKTD